MGNINYKHVISLGYFCSVALELERIGLRDAAYPFDWCISDFSGVIALIENEFSELFDFKWLEQYKPSMNIYRNSKYNIEFYHDFSAYKSLEEQLVSVKEKYRRRINRFYKDIKEPTLFVRYIDDKKDNNGEFQELKWIEENKDKIGGVLKSYCKYNEIIYVGNSCLSSEIINIFSVEKDKNDNVARRPLEKNKELELLLSTIDCTSRQKNVEIYKDKERQKKKISVKLNNKIEEKIIYKIKNKYEWNRQYE